jgi:hypothetical protein
MFRFAAIILLTSTAATAQLVDHTQPPPQTPRQALLEVLQSKNGSAIERHLPDITKKKLRELGTNGGPSGLGVIPATGLAGMMGSSDKLEIFEAGPVLARVENGHNGEKIEITIENEDFRSDEDDIELAFRMYKNGEETMHWYTPRILLHLKQEGGIWRFTEIGFSARMPLANPEFLEAMGKEMTAGRQVSAGSSAVASLRALVTAEIQYASSYPEVGFTCSLANLGSEGIRPGTRKQQPNELHAMFIDDVLASGHKNGYAFAIANCDSRPATRFIIAAVPESPNSGQRSFCADQSGAIRYATDGKAETCLASGKPLQ